jgi:hypothetical protein
MLVNTTVRHSSTTITVMPVMKLARGVLALQPDTGAKNESASSRDRRKEIQN